MEYAAFFKQLGCSHVAAWVVLPREEMIVRQIAMPGVRESDLEAAIRFQLDSLHPYGEDAEVAFAWKRLGKGANILIGLMRQEALNRYTALFAEAGVKIASFTFSAAVLYSSARIFSDPPEGFLQMREPENGERGLEVYGESPTRPVFSALLEMSRERAASVAASELRLPADTQPELLPELTRSAALNCACPWLTLDANLLPESLRSSTSRARYIPAMVLGGLLAILAAAVLLQAGYEDRRYVAALEAEIRKLEPRAAKVKQLDVAAAAMLGRSRQLDAFRLRTKQDLDALNEVTRLLAPPNWLNSFDLMRTTLQIGGEADQAAALLKLLDGSPHFANSEFTIPIARMQNGEAFRIRAQREGLEEK
jgi:Tfp pilus assembly protein PilN